jgi:hypothetical protein
MRILYYAVVALGRLMAGKLDALKAALPPVGVKKDLTPSQDVFWRDSLRCSWIFKMSSVVFTIRWSSYPCSISSLVRMSEGMTRSLDRRLEGVADLFRVALEAFSSFSEILLVRTELCFLANAIGHPAVQAGLSPIRKGNSYMVTSTKDTDRCIERPESSSAVLDRRKDDSFAVLAAMMKKID